MIEFSFAEIALFCWAVIATGYALKYKQMTHMAEFVLRKMMEDKNVRDQMVTQWEKVHESEG